MRKLWAVSRKEFCQIRRDPLSLLILLGLPAMLLVLYGFALSFDVRHVALAVQDRDRTRASRDLVLAFERSTYFDVAARPGPADDQGRILETRAAKAILVIPERYGRELAAGRKARVQLVLDGTDALTATTILGYAGSLVSGLNSDALRRVLVPRRSGRAPGVDFAPRVWYNPELESTRFLVPGLIGMLLMLTAVVSTSLSVVREKERGTMEQLRVAPIHTVQLILGKVLPYLGIALVSMVIILVVARALFGVEVKGSHVDLLVATLVYLAGALGFGLLISTVAENQARAFEMALMSSLLPTTLLSGFIFQIRCMPTALQWITCAFPARYYLVVLRGVITKGADLEPYWDQMGYLSAYAVIVLALASIRLSRQEG